MSAEVYYMALCLPEVNQQRMQEFGGWVGGADDVSANHRCTHPWYLKPANFQSF